MQLGRSLWFWLQSPAEASGRSESVASGPVQRPISSMISYVSQHMLSYSAFDITTIFLIKDLQLRLSLPFTP